MICDICGFDIEPQNLDEASFSPFFACCVNCSNDADGDDWAPPKDED
jgi:hypothetical protein